MSHNKKPRFILVDPSALHTGGHHYEYAARILKIANAEGFETQLWAHRKAELPQDDFKILKLMRKSFYENFRVLPQIAVVDAVRHTRSAMSMLGRLYNGMLNRSLPFFMETRLGLDAARAFHDGTQGRFKPVYNAPHNKLKTSVLSYTIFYAIYQVGCRVRKLGQSVKASAFVNAIAILLAVLLSPLLLLAGIGLGVYALVRLYQVKPHHVLAQDISKGISGEGGWSPQDIIFIPTCYLTEIRALAEFLNSWDKSKPLPQFHLLFRTNIFTGHTNSFRNQLNNHPEFRQAFKWIEASFPSANVHYYTDTPQLSAQYKVLTDVDFKVLPVPVPDAAPVTGQQSKPLNIVYMGDVRDEKGYQFYPKIIEALWSDYILTGKIRFTLQSNFADNPDVSRESAISQSLLQSMPPEYVTHVKGPLSSAQYQELIDSADIILLTYKPEHYFARSSGIFIEALKAGKAVLMPSMTWMTAEIEPMRQARWRRALEGGKPFSAAEDKTGQESVDIKLNPKMQCHALVEFELSSMTGDTLFIEVTANAFDKNGHKLDDEQICVVQADGQGKACALLGFAEGAESAILGYKVIGGSIRLKQSRVTVFDTEWKEPMHYAASVYSYQETRYMIAALRELIEEIDLYKKDAAEFARIRGQYFTPQTLVQNLLEEAGYKADENREAA